MTCPVTIDGGLILFVAILISGMVGFVVGSVLCYRED
jgi:hypothetical protein